MTHPFQDFELKNAVVRFKRNAIVEYLLDKGPYDLNSLAIMGFTQSDWVQFAQLIGYSLCGFHELSYVPDSVALAASQKAREQFGDETIGGCRDSGCEIHCGVDEDDSP